MKHTLQSVETAPLPRVCVCQSVHRGGNRNTLVTVSFVGNLFVSCTDVFVIREIQIISTNPP